MKRNVDLTLGREFRDLDERNIHKRLNCEECGKPIQIPWRYSCSDCWHFMQQVHLKRFDCALQLRYDRHDRKPKKYDFNLQLRTPRWYYSKDMRRALRCQLNGTYSRNRRRLTCREQLRS